MVLPFVQNITNLPVIVHPLIFRSVNGDLGRNGIELYSSANPGTDTGCFIILYRNAGKDTGCFIILYRHPGTDTGCLIILYRNPGTDTGCLIILYRHPGTDTG